MAQAISIIVPVLDEEPGIAEFLDRLAPARAAGVEVIVADGGSSDSTVSIALPRCDILVNAPRGRAAQMNAGAAQASGDILLFLHADTQLPAEWMQAVLRGTADTGRTWGMFAVRIEGRSAMLPLVAALMNLRSRLSRIATGDQAIFVRRETFAAVGGFPAIALMEDIALSAKLKRAGAPLCLRERVTTSGRRWDAQGAWRTIVQMWRLRLAYFFGAEPADLARRYGHRPERQSAKGQKE